MEEMFLQKRISLLFSDFSGKSFRALSVDLRLKSLKKKSFCFLNVRLRKHAIFHWNDGLRQMPLMDLR